MKSSRYGVARRFLIFWCLFIGLGAFSGGGAMLIRPDGSLLQMQAMLPYFEKLPLSSLLFRDYVFPGIALICVNGITNITAAALLLKRKKAGITCGMLFGVTLMLWICIQFYMFPANLLSTLYFIFGICQALTGYAAWVFYTQEQFRPDEASYKNIGTNARELVVYFSRMGYTKKFACEEANRTGAALYELSTPEPTRGTGGFWWCGFFALRGKPMPIAPLTLDLTRFEHVTICSPIWVCGLCSPMLSFCMQARGKLRSVSYVLVHHSRMRYAKVVRDTDALLSLRHRSALSLRCDKGRLCQRVDLS